jgi:predicted component of type VI protein secretion system
MYQEQTQTKAAEFTNPTQAVSITAAGSFTAKDESNNETSTVQQDIPSDSSTPITVSLDQEEHEDYLDWKANSKKRRIGKRLKKMDQKATSKRHTLVLRRVDCKAIAPDEDVAAYGAIYELMEMVPNRDTKKKISVTDNHIKAYHVLNPEFKSDPTLEELQAKVKEMVNTGVLPTEDEESSDSEEFESEE